MRERLKYILFDMIIIMILCAAHVYEKTKCVVHTLKRKIVLKYLENNDLRSMIFLFTF